jgi:hypothetical protein
VGVIRFEVVFVAPDNVNFCGLRPVRQLRATSLVLIARPTVFNHIVELAAVLLSFFAPVVVACTSANFLQKSACRFGQWQRGKTYKPTESTRIDVCETRKVKSQQQRAGQHKRRARQTVRQSRRGLPL